MTTLHTYIKVGFSFEPWLRTVMLSNNHLVCHAYKHQKECLPRVPSLRLRWHNPISIDVCSIEYLIITLVKHETKLHLVFTLSRVMIPSTISHCTSMCLSYDHLAMVWIATGDIGSLVLCLNGIPIVKYGMCDSKVYHFHFAFSKLRWWALSYVMNIS